VAWVLLLLLLLGLAHSTYSMFMGRLTQGLMILPLLMAVYVWVVGRKQSRESRENAESSPPGEDDG
jgi:Ca2+/Na+ antiporter